MEEESDKAVEKWNKRVKKLIRKNMVKGIKNSYGNNIIYGMGKLVIVREKRNFGKFYGKQIMLKIDQI